MTGHPPPLTPKYEAEGRARPRELWQDSDASVPLLHYQQGHEENRVVLAPDGSPELAEGALSLFSRISRKDNPTPARDVYDEQAAGRRWLTVPEVSRLLEIPANAIHKAIGRGKFPGVQPLGPGGRFHVPVDQLEQHLYANRYAHDVVRDLRATWTAWLEAEAEEE
jgi:hypothetical protein